MLQAEDYKAVNPLSQLPALTDGNVTIFESGAIVEFLLARYGKCYNSLLDKSCVSHRICHIYFFIK